MGTEPRAFYMPGAHYCWTISQLQDFSFSYTSVKGDFGSYPGLLLFRLDSVTFQYPFIGDAIDKILFFSHYVEVQIPSMVSLFSLPMTEVIQAHSDSGYLESMCPSSSMFSKHHTALNLWSSCLCLCLSTQIIGIGRPYLSFVKVLTRSQDTSGRDFSNPVCNMWWGLHEADNEWSCPQVPAYLLLAPHSVPTVLVWHLQEADTAVRRARGLLVCERSTSLSWRNQATMEIWNMKGSTGKPIWILKDINFCPAKRPGTAEEPMSW